MPSLVLKSDVPVSRISFPENFNWDPNAFEAFCLLNPTIHAELDRHGNIILMSPSNLDADGKNTELLRQISNWAHEIQTFKCFGPTGGLRLSNNAVRAPDASLIHRKDWEALSREQQKSFPPIAPFFALELRSSNSESLPEAEAKMNEYIECGTQLAWLVDPLNNQLTIYRPNTPPQTLQRPPTASAAPECPGLQVDFTEIWE